MLQYLLGAIIGAFLFLVTASHCHAQNPPQKVNTWYQFKGVTCDTVLNLPKRQPGSFYRDSGSLYYQTADSNVYVWTGNIFKCVSCGGVSPTLTAIGGGDTIVSNNIERGGQLTKNTLVKYNNFVPQISVPNPGTGDGSWVLTKVFSPRAGARNLDWIQTVESINAGQFDTSHNEVMKWGWNINRSIKSNQPGEHYAMESNYNPFGTGRYMENHLEIATPDGASTRLFSNTTIFAANDSSIASSQWDFRQNKYNFFDIQGNQCVTLNFATGKSSMTFFWDQLVDNTQVGFGWSSDGSQWNMNNNGAGGKTMQMHGWSTIDQSDAATILWNGNTGQCASCSPVNGGPVAFLNDIHPAGNVADSSNIGYAGFQFRNSYVKNGFVQRLKVGDDLSVAPAASAQVDVVSTTRGFLPPRMTTTQKNAIASPAEGLVVYDLTLHKLCVFTGTVWETITSL